MLETLNFHRFQKGFPLVIKRMPSQTTKNLHTHDFVELVIVLGGNGIHYNGKESYEIMAGDCFVVDGAHGYQVKSRLSLVNILYMPGQLALPWNEARKIPGYNAFFVLEPKVRNEHHFQNRLRLAPLELARVSALLDSLESELNEKAPGFEVMSLAFFLEIIGFLSRAFVRREDSGDNLLGIAEVISHIERRYAEPIHMKELLAIACLSESQLLRVFRKATGFPPIDYLIRLRVKHAKELLRASELSISEVARQVGFSDTNYFTRQFQRITGMIPRNYRKLNI